MANTKSAEKKNRQRIKNEARNSSRKSEMRTAIKKLRAAIEANDDKAAKAALGTAVRLLDRAGQKGTIKKATASRQVSRLTKATAGIARA